MNPITILPVGDRILVRPDEAPGMSRGGIILPDGSKEDSCFGSVVGIGAGKAVVTPNGIQIKVVTVCKVGDRVLFRRYQGVPVEIDGTHYKVMSEDDILCTANVKGYENGAEEAKS